jgi:hypothetical protein
MPANGKPVTNAELQTALTAMKDELRAELTEMKTELVEFTRQVETNLLTEFHRYAKAQQVRLHSLEMGEADVKQRLAVIEERLLALEVRRPPSV